ncbi:HNH endonuclease [Nocardioides sambongensis]|uniref:HNH endonuclease n=1 Tax=Nocardioides sambongensis TaxID=2589074 RepID=UPI00112D485B|nr:HNH endonuclease signature motif containing protein [Nocardioides sambongensis]
MVHGRKPATLIATDQVAEWCQTPGTSVRVTPVIDTRTTLTAHGYAIPPRVREQIRLRDGVCAFPYCARPAGAADLDHIRPYSPVDGATPADPGAPTDHRIRGGPTSSANLAPLCRGHHRAKTTGGWTYTPGPDPGHYFWRSPHGQHFHTHGHQTWDLTPAV